MSRRRGRRTDAPLEARDFGLLALVALTGVASVAMLAAPSEFHAGSLHLLATASGVASVGLLVSWRLRRQSEARALAAERQAQRAMEAAEPPAPPSLVVLVLAVPSIARGPLSAIAAGAPVRELLAHAAGFVARHPWRAKASLVVTPSKAGAPIDPSAALDELSARHRAPQEASYRGGTATRSREGAGWSVMAVALVVRGAGRAIDFGDRTELRAAIDVVMPAHTDRVIAREVRWIPDADTAALDDEALLTTFPTLLELPAA